MGILTGIILAAAIAGLIILNLPAFGRLPRGSRLERILQSPNYRDGQFRNLEASPMMTGDKSRLSGILEFLFRKKEGLRPDAAVPARKTDLRALDRDSNLLVWFGHSSYLLQAEGRRVLVDPVFRAAAPFSFLNRPFKGTDIYRPGDMPDVDLLVITHDHWDHLDYRTVTELKSRIGKVVCPLGVGERPSRRSGALRGRFFPGARTTSRELTRSGKSSERRYSVHQTRCPSVVGRLETSPVQVRRLSRPVRESTATSREGRSKSVFSATSVVSFRDTG